MDFYDQLTPFYHLIYPDWEAAIAQQGQQLDQVIREYWDGSVEQILDVSCGIGTQAIALAKQGYRVTASDLSAKEVARAKQEAQRRNLELQFSVCDMREVYDHYQRQFDLVISCDNSVPHLLDDTEILRALRQFYACTRSGGGCIITLRDYAKETRGKGIVKPYGVREVSNKRYLIFQIWDFEGEIYDLSLYFIEDDLKSVEATTHVMRSRYYAIHTDHLMQLMEVVGYTSVTRLEHAFFQPVLVGKKPLNEKKS